MESKSPVAYSPLNEPATQQQAAPAHRRLLTSPRFLRNVGLLSFFVWFVCIASIHSSHAFGVMLGVTVLVAAIAGAYSGWTAPEKTAREWCKLRLPQAAPAQQSQQPQRLEGQPLLVTVVRMPDGSTAIGDGELLNAPPSAAVPAAVAPTASAVDADPEATMRRRLWRSLTVACVPFAVLGVFYGSVFGVFLSALPSICTDDDVVGRWAVAIACILGFVVIFPATVTASYLGKLGGYLERISPLLAAECSNDNLTITGKVAFAFLRACAVSGFALTAGVILGLVPGIVASLFHAMGTGNGFAIAFFFLLLAVIAAVLFMRHKRNQQQQAAAAAAVGVPAAAGSEMRTLQSGAQLSDIAVQIPVEGKSNSGAYPSVPSLAAAQPTIAQLPSQSQQPVNYASTADHSAPPAYPQVR